MNDVDKIKIETYIINMNDINIESNYDKIIKRIIKENKIKKIKKILTNCNQQNCNEQNSTNR